MSFTENIKLWVKYDNEYKEQQERLKKLREQRNLLENNIIEHINDNNLKNATIQITDGILKFGQTKTSSPLTFKYIEECLNDIISDKEQITNIINYIKEKRVYKNTENIRRLYNK